MLKSQHCVTPVLNFFFVLSNEISLQALHATVSSSQCHVTQYRYCHVKQYGYCREWGLFWVLLSSRTF